MYNIFLLLPWLILICYPSYSNAGWVQFTNKEVNYKEVFQNVLDKVKGSYVEEISEKQLIEASLNGMLSSLDPHSTFFDAQSYEEVQSIMNGEFAGVGLEITMKNNNIVVVTPYEDAPAFKAGIKIGDIITSIDGQIIRGLSLEQASLKMRGEAGTYVRVSVYRESLAKTLTFNIRREVIKIFPVKSKLIDEDILYLRVASFYKDMVQDAKNAISKTMKGKDMASIKGLILDLRWNPGGLFDQSIGLSELFMDHGVIVKMRGRSLQSEKIFEAKGKDITHGAPIVVMVNGGSASASEIVAGALQDNKRGIVLGTKTFGKGSVQDIIPITSDTAIKLTVARYYTPNDHSIQAIGIVPNITVEEAKVVPIESSSMPSESSLPGHLAQENEVENVSKRIGSEQISDYQLLRAIDLINGMALYKQGS